MVKIITRGAYKTRSVEPYFNDNWLTFAFEDTSYLAVFYVRKYGRGTFFTPNGLVTADELPLEVKLAICMVERPYEFFTTLGVNEFYLERILNLPAGTVELAIDEPLKYDFHVDVETEFGEHLTSSADINDRLFYKGGALM